MDEKNYQFIFVSFGRVYNFSDVVYSEIKQNKLWVNQSLEHFFLLICKHENEFYCIESDHTLIVQTYTTDSIRIL